MEFDTGAEFVVHGLEKRPELNGKAGRVIGALLESSGRLTEEIGDERVMLRPQNMLPTTEPPPARAEADGSDGELEEGDRVQHESHGFGVVLGIAPDMWSHDGKVYEASTPRHEADPPAYDILLDEWARDRPETTRKLRCSRQWLTVVSAVEEMAGALAAEAAVMDAALTSQWGASPKGTDEPLKFIQSRLLASQFRFKGTRYDACAYHRCDGRGWQRAGDGADGSSAPSVSLVPTPADPSGAQHAVLRFSCGTASDALECIARCTVTDFSSADSECELDPPDAKDGDEEDDTNARRHWATLRVAFPGLYAEPSGTIYGTLVPGSAFLRDGDGALVTKWGDLALDLGRLLLVMRPANPPAAPFPAWLTPAMVREWETREDLCE